MDTLAISKVKFTLAQRCEPLKESKRAASRPEEDHDCPDSVSRKKLTVTMDWPKKAKIFRPELACSRRRVAPGSLALSPPVLNNSELEWHNSLQDNVSGNVARRQAPPHAILSLSGMMLPSKWNAELTRG